MSIKKILELVVIDFKWSNGQKGDYFKLHSFILYMI